MPNHVPDPPHPDPHPCSPYPTPLSLSTHIPPHNYPFPPPLLSPLICIHPPLNTLLPTVHPCLSQALPHPLPRISPLNRPSHPSSVPRHRHSRSPCPYLNPLPHLDRSPVPSHVPISLSPPSLAHTLQFSLAPYIDAPSFWLTSGVALLWTYTGIPLWCVANRSLGRNAATPHGGRRSPRAGGEGGHL